jgi:hypothetical protein
MEDILQEHQRNLAQRRPVRKGGEGNQTAMLVSMFVFNIS